MEDQQRPSRKTHSLTTPELGQELSKEELDDVAGGNNGGNTAGPRRAASLIWILYHHQ